MRLLSLFTTLLLITSCAPQSNAPKVDNAMAEREANIQREIVLKEQRQYFERVMKIGYKIQKSNTELCGKKIAPDFGFAYGVSTQYPKEYKPVAERLFGLRDDPTVYHVFPNSLAQGKLKMGDVIKQVDDQVIKSGLSGIKKLNKIFNEEDYIDQPVTFIVDRRGEEKQITLTPPAICSGKIAITTNNVINAYADGENIIIDSGMMDFAKKDSELALVIGHELAHNTRKHVEAKQGNALLGMVLGAVVTGVTGINVMGLGSDLGALAHSQGFEAEADYIGIYHSARAGYDISEAPQLWRRMGAKNPQGIHLAGTTHPSTAKRLIALEMAAKEIADKKKRGEALIPAEKTKEDFKATVSDYNT